jgi:hypothetical protein
MDANLFRRYVEPATPSRATERGELLKEFMDTINISRKGTKYPLMNIQTIGVLVGKIPTPDLYFLLSICKDAGKRHKKGYSDGFSMKFFYEIKPKVDEPNPTKPHNTRR